MQEYRLTRGMSQEQFAERTELTANYIARVERGESFPRLDSLNTIINSLGVAADTIFCDVIDQSADYPISALFQELESLSPNDKLQITEIVRVLVHQAKKREQDSAKRDHMAYSRFWDVHMGSVASFTAPPASEK